jgi:hypothetical protein
MLHNAPLAGVNTTTRPRNCRRDVVGRGGFCAGSTIVAGLELTTVDEVAEIVLLAGLVSLFAYPTALKMRRQARLRKSPTGFRETVTVQAMLVDDAVRRWGKLGYDLDERRDDVTHSPRMGVPVVRATLTFIKR